MCWTEGLMSASYVLVPSRCRASLSLWLAAVVAVSSRTTGAPSIVLSIRGDDISAGPLPLDDLTDPRLVYGADVEERGDAPLDDGECLPALETTDQVQLGPARMCALGGMEDEARIHALDYTMDPRATVRPCRAS